MKVLSKRRLIPSLVLAILAASWALPPFEHSARHLCPLRPSVVPGAQALPFMARKYRTSCMTCHEMFPRLNAFGEAVRLNGFRWPDAESSVDKDKEARKDEPVILGNEAYKKAFPDAVWPSDIMGFPPLSIRGIPSFTKTSGTGGRSNEWEWEVETGGSIGEMMSYFGHYNLHSKSDPAAATATNSALVAQINVENLAGPQHLVNMQFGIVGMEEANYNFYRSHATGSFLPNGSPRSFARTQTLPYPAGFNKANLFKLRRGPGAMLWGFTPWTNYAVGYREGDQDGGGSDMNVGFFQYAYKIGGMDHFGRTAQKWDQGYKEKSLSLGLLGDLGSQRVRSGADGVSPVNLDTFWRAGGDAMLKLAAWTARAGGVVGEHSHPYATLDTGRAKVSTWFGETDYHWFPWLLTELRYEEEYIAVPSGLNLGKTNRGRFVPVIAALYGPNVRFQLSAETYTNHRRDNKGGLLDPNTITFLIDFAL